MSSREISLKISLLLNIILVVALLGGTTYFLVRSFQAATQMDGRPKGALIALRSAREIVGRDGTTFVLPAGTILQESTPQGAATLGKISHREYLLVIATEDFDFSTNRPTEKRSDWMEPYTFGGGSMNKEYHSHENPSP